MLEYSKSPVVRWSLTIGALALFLVGIASVTWGTSANVPGDFDPIGGLARMVFGFFVCVLGTVLGFMSLAIWIKFHWDRHSQGF